MWHTMTHNGSKYDKYKEPLTNIENVKDADDLFGNNVTQYLAWRSPTLESDNTQSVSWRFVWMLQFCLIIMALQTPMGKKE